MSAREKKLSISEITSAVRPAASSAPSRADIKRTRVVAERSGDMLGTLPFYQATLDTPGDGDEDSGRVLAVRRCGERRSATNTQLRLWFIGARREGCAAIRSSA
jgi:hypothetical protein